jgi:hypothetical protein
MKLRPPFGMSAFSHAGEEIQISDDGSVSVSTELAKELITTHGFEPWDFSQYSREQLLSRASALAMTKIAAMSNEDLAKMLDYSAKHDAEAAASSAISSDATALETFDFETMERTELFAFIKARGGAPAPATADATLRKIAASLPASLLTDPAHTEV